MSAALLCVEPKWLHDLPVEEHASALLAYHLNIAALHASPSGTMKELADRIGWSESGFSQAKRRGVLAPRICIMVEQLVGRDIMPRERLSPEFFAVED